MKNGRMEDSRITKQEEMQKGKVHKEGENEERKKERMNE